MDGTRSFLMLFAAVSAQVVDDHRLRLPEAFVTGMRLHLHHWQGPVIAVMRQSAQAPALSPSYPRADLGFEVRLIPEGRPLSEALTSGPGAVLASVDLPDQLDIGARARALGLTVIYGAERVPEALLWRALRDPRRGFLRRLWSFGWNYRQEAGRRAALSKADAIHLNGFPAAGQYSSLNRNPLRYLENRMRKPMMANSRDMALRRHHHDGGAPLRLIHTGPLEPAEGVALLLPLAARLAALDLPFNLAIHGDGSLAAQLRAEIAAKGLEGRVSLTPALPFGEMLVPQMRLRGDIFISLCSHSDPISSYIEAMGCGLPVLGFENHMLSPLLRRSLGGWAVPAGDIGAMVRLLADLARDRMQILTRAEAGLSYSRRHSAEAEFAARMAHIDRIHSERSGASLTFAAKPDAHGRAKS